MRRSFIFYASWLDAIESLPRDVQFDALHAIVVYGIRGEEDENLRPIARMVLSMAKGNIDANYKRWENGCKGGAPKGICNNPTGRRGGRASQEQTKNKPKTNQKQTKNKPKTNQEQTKNKPNVNVNVNENVDVNVNEGEKEKKKEKTASRFSPPSLDEIKNYVREKNLRMTAEAFYDHFTSNGWKVSGIAPMKDWKAAVRNWARREARLTHQKPEEIGVILHTDKDKYKNQKLW